MRLQSKTLVAGSVVLALVLCGFAANSYLRAAAFVVRAAGMQGIARRAAGIEANAFDEQALTVPWRGGTLRARLYTPRGRSVRAVLLVPGVHAAGVDEPRLVGFARDLASMGHTVLTAELEDLTRYRITPRTTDMIEDAASWLSRQQALAPDGHIGMMGISFAGGLSIVAAGRPSIRDRVSFVLSFGGHGDLPRTLQYLCTGIQPDGSHRPPHDYGVAIVLLGVAERVVPVEQVQPLGDAILAFLDGSRYEGIDHERAKKDFEHARALADALPEPARTLMGYVNARDVVHLGPILAPHAAALGGDPALSPALASPPAAPIYLLHGADDNVIPAIESVLLADSLRAHGVEVHQLATPLITHAEVDKSASVGAVWKLIAFWEGVLGE
jgi:dienelactone hydrolase